MPKFPSGSIKYHPSIHSFIHLYILTSIYLSDMAITPKHNENLWMCIQKEKTWTDEEGEQRWAKQICVPSRWERLSLTRAPYFMIHTLTGSITIALREAPLSYFTEAQIKPIGRVLLQKCRCMSSEKTCVSISLRWSRCPWLSLSGKHQKKENMTNE